MMKVVKCLRKSVVFIQSITPALNRVPRDDKMVMMLSIVMIVIKHQRDGFSKRRDLHNRPAIPEGSISGDISSSPNDSHRTASILVIQFLDSERLSRI
jgi:hypothetical protein